MSITEMQACLARLYVNESFRKWFYLDPIAALEGYSLTDQERDALGKLDRRALELFASSLISKRRKRMERAFPALFALDGNAMRRYYARFYQLYSMRPSQSGQQEVLDFGKFIEESLAGADHVPAYACDLARFERLHYAVTAASASRSGPADVAKEDPRPVHTATMEARPVLSPGVQLADFAYDVGEIEQALQKGHPPQEVRQTDDGCSIVFRSATNGSGTQMLRINRPTKTVLCLCDGCNTITQIVSKTEGALGAADLEVVIVETINRLLASQVLEVDRDRNPAAATMPLLHGVSTVDEAM